MGIYMRPTEKKYNNKMYSLCSIQNQVQEE